MGKFVNSVCPHDCPSACALEVEILDNDTIGQVRGAKDNDYTLGVICSKVANYAERTHHPDRLKYPLKRVGPKGSGQFERISWDEALETVVEQFQQATDSFGSQSVWPYFYGGTMGQLQRDGVVRLSSTLNYSGRIGNICTNIGYAGWRAGCGSVRGSDARDVRHSKLIIIWGCNAVATSINFMKHVSRAQRENSAKLVVIDPAKTGTANKADIHIAPKPGTDGALASAMMHVLFSENLADWQYMEKYTDDPSGLQSTLIDKTPQWAEDITGVPASDIIALARLYGTTEKSFIRLGIGFSRSQNGAHNIHAVSCLPAVTGAWQHQGGGALLGSSGSFALSKNYIEGHDYMDSNSRQLDMCRIGAVLNSEENDLKGGPSVKAMLIQNTNPMAVAPDSSYVKKGFMRDDLFVCVHEQFMTQTAAMADIVLPATSFVEHDDVYTSFGHTYLQFASALINPYYESRSNHQVVCDLANRLGAKHPAFSQTAKEVINQALLDSNYPDVDTLKENKWHDCASDHAEMNYLGGFDWPDKRFRFKPDWQAAGDIEGIMPAWPGHWDTIFNADETHPFRLITPPARRFLNTSFTQSPHSLKGEHQPCVHINVVDAEMYGVQDEQIVVLGNVQGQVEIKARISDRIQPGVLESRGIWPGTSFKGGTGINTLISAKSPCPDGGAAFHDCAVWIKLVN
ncbi:MAG: anaerobic selenocysteine-containing dehydrogenase [Parasphingorhabdus sp.]|jgi:anaerobic selenocysteine-containing dehydrogenase